MPSCSNQSAPPRRASESGPLPSAGRDAKALGSYSPSLQSAARALWGDRVSMTTTR
jgi:hypothetical protein